MRIIRRCARARARTFSSPRLGTSRGAGLVEIILATVIISLVTLGVVEFFAKGRFWFDHEEHKRVATLLCQDAMERTVSRDYAAIVNWGETRTVDRTTYTLAVTVVEGTPDPQMKTVRCAVSWRTRPGAPERRVSLSTLVRVQ